MPIHIYALTFAVVSCDALFGVFPLSLSVALNMLLLAMTLSFLID